MKSHARSDAEGRACSMEEGRGAADSEVVGWRGGRRDACVSSMDWGWERVSKD